MSEQNSKSNGGRVPRALRLSIFQRLEAGETQAPIAAEFGVTRQYIALLHKRFRENGGVEPTTETRGRKKKRELSPEEIAKIGELMDRFPSPKAAGIRLRELPNQWYVRTVQKLIERELKFSPTQKNIYESLRSKGVSLIPSSIDDIDFEKTWKPGVWPNHQTAAAVTLPPPKVPAKKTKTKPEGLGEQAPQRQKRRGRASKIDPITQEIQKLELRIENLTRNDSPPLKVASSKKLPIHPGQRVGKHKKSNISQKSKRRQKRK